MPRLGAKFQQLEYFNSDEDKLFPVMIKIYLILSHHLQTSISECLQKQCHISPVIKHPHITDTSYAYIDVSPCGFSVTLDTKNKNHIKENQTQIKTSKYLKQQLL